MERIDIDPRRPSSALLAEIHSLTVLSAALYKLVKSAQGSTVNFASEELSSVYETVFSRLDERTREVHSMLVSEGFDREAEQIDNYEVLLELSVPSSLEDDPAADPPPDLEWIDSTLEPVVDVPRTLFESFGSRATPLESSTEQLLAEVDRVSRDNRHLIHVQEAHLNSLFESRDFKGELQSLLLDHKIEQLFDGELLQAIKESLDEVLAAFSQGLFKTVCILSGSVVEAIINEVLTLHEPDARSEYFRLDRTTPASHHSIPDTREWNFGMALMVARDLEVIERGQYYELRKLKNLRNGIHIHNQIKYGNSYSRVNAMHSLYLLNLAVTLLHSNRQTEADGE